MNEGDFTDYYCTAANILGKATSKIELIELRSATTHIEPIRIKSTTGFEQSPASSSSTSTTAVSKSATRALYDVNKSMNNNLVHKSNETVVKVSVKDENLMSSSGEETQYGTGSGKTTHKNRIHKLPNYRSNKANGTHTKHSKSTIDFFKFCNLL